MKPERHGFSARTRYSGEHALSFCQNPDTKVIDTRISDDGHSIRRRRVCPKCSKRFTTVETSMLLVTKRSGGVEPFSRDKVISGVRKLVRGGRSEKRI